MIPAVAQALQDKHLRPSDYRVYGYCLERLDLMEFRPIKASAAGHWLKMARTHVSRSLRRLCRAGYLEVSNTRGKQLRSYRLRLSVPASVHSQAA